MAHIAVTPRAPGRFRTGNLAHQLRVAPHTVGFDDFTVLLSDADRLVKVLKGETLGMPVSVNHLRRVLADQIVRRVAVVAGRDRVVRGLLPPVVLLAHDVTVHAGRGVIGCLLYTSPSPRDS